jgi:hypothetical protein
VVVNAKSPHKKRKIIEVPKDSSVDTQVMVVATEIIVAQADKDTSQGQKVAALKPPTRGRDRPRNTHSGILNLMIHLTE